MKAYENKTCILATKHQKEEAIAPAFLEFLGLKVVNTNIDTDRFGTFTGEVERKGSALTCAREKCETALSKARAKLAIASEGSFGPHPYIPFAACDHEILYFIDRERGFALHESKLSAQTNYCAEAIADIEGLKAFCMKALFPSHGLIVSPNKPKNTLIIKGIQSYEELDETFLRCCRISEDGKALVQTDMRAHMNPTRMEVIRQLAQSLAKRLATPCPSCYNPGWGLVETLKGLECGLCGSETEMVKYEVFGCLKCGHKENRPREDGLAHAEPQNCTWCNP